MRLFSGKSRSVIHDIFPGRKRAKQSTIPAPHCQSGENPYFRSLIPASIQLAKAGMRCQNGKDITYRYELAGEATRQSALVLTLSMTAEQERTGNYTTLKVEEKDATNGNLRKVFESLCLGEGRPCAEYTCGDWEDRIFVAADEGQRRNDLCDFIKNLGVQQGCGLI